MAAIFDMDGLMVDTEPLWQEAEMAVFAEVGVVLSREDCKQTTGLRIDEVVAHWHSVHPWDTAARPQADIVEGVINALIALIHARGELLPGVENAIGAMKECGLRLAVASSSSKRLINCVLDKFDLHKHFELYRSAEDEKYGKPHPGVYISAAEALGVEPVRCVALEDSFNGLLSAKAARMKTIAVPEPESRSQPRFVIADHQLASLEEVTADMIRALKLS